MIDPLNHPDTYLKLFWKAAPPDRQELRLIWADGNRYSQASLPVQSNSQQPSWSVTFTSKQIRMFGKMVQNQDLKKAQFLTKNAEQRFYLSLNRGSHSPLYIAYLLNPARRWSGRVLELPYTQAIFPGNFPTLRTPISRITVSHQQVHAALLSLKQEWESLHPSANPLTIIELSLTTSGTSHTLTLSTGQIDTPITRSVEGTDGSIAGPQIRVRLDCASLQQVLNSAQQQVNRWQLCIDRNADAIQCLPEPDILSDSTLLWRHQLRSL